MAGSWYINGDGPMCSNAFTDYFQRAVLAYYCLYLFFSLLILLACCCLYRRSGAGKKLIGPTYIVALLFAIFAYMISLASLIMRECGVDNPEQDEALYCAISILDYLSMWALLLVMFYKLNSMLRKKLGSTGRVFTAIPLVLCGIVLALTLVYLAMSNYIYMSRALGERTSDTMAYATERLGMALRVIYLFSVMVSFAFSVMNISALRRAHLPGGDLIGWVVGLHACMFIWSLLAVITTGLSVFTDIWKLDMSLGLLYVTTLFQTLSFVFVLGIAKHVCWRNEILAQQVFAPVTHEQEAYEYASGEQNYYQSPPEIIHAK